MFFIYFFYKTSRKNKVYCCYSLLWLQRHKFASRRKIKFFFFFLTRGVIKKTLIQNINVHFLTFSPTKSYFIYLVTAFRPQTVTIFPFGLTGVMATQLKQQPSRHARCRAQWCVQSCDKASGVKPEATYWMFGTTGVDHKLSFHGDSEGHLRYIYVNRMRASRQQWYQSVRRFTKHWLKWASHPLHLNYRRLFGICRV